MQIGREMTDLEVFEVLSVILENPYNSKKRIEIINKRSLEALVILGGYIII